MSTLVGELLFAAGERDSYEDGWRGVEDAEGRWQSLRASLPPVFLVVFPFWFSIATTIDVLFGRDMQVALFAAVAGLFAVAPAIVLFRLGHGLHGCIVVGLALGVALGGAHAYTLHVSQGAVLSSSDAMELVIIRDSREGEFGAQVVARTSFGAKVRLSLSAGEQFYVGDKLIVMAKWKEPNAKTARDCWHDGIVANASVGSCERVAESGLLGLLREFRVNAINEVASCAETLRAWLGVQFDDASLMLCAVVLGYTDGLYDSQLYHAVRVDGLAHMVAVSGAHLAIVCGAVALMFRRLPIARGLSIATQVSLIAAYLVLTGIPVSAIRAAFMAILGLLSYFGGRRPYALGALSCGVGIMVALDPTIAFSTSFILSVGATAGIIVFMPFFTELLQGAFAMPGGAISESLALTLAASFVTGPISACQFGQVSLIAPLANLLATPLFPVICIGGLIAICLAVCGGLVGSVLLSAMIVLVELLCGFLTVFSHIPFASSAMFIDTATAVLLALVVPVLLWAFWPRPTRRMAFALAGLVGLSLAVWSLQPLLRGDTVTMLDIGQGDAILIQSKGRALLIDTGTEDTALLEGLARCGVRGLDAIVISHPDDDHCGALGALCDVIPVDRVLVARDLPGEGNEHCAGLMEEAARLVGTENIIGLSVGDTFDLGNTAFVVIGPDAFADGGGNADSLVLCMGYDQNGDGNADLTGLFCGDAESEQVNAYIAKGRIGDVDIYKVGHHGSRAAVDEKMLATLKPEVSLVSVGAYNRYGHPVPETIEQLEASGSVVYRTDQQGMVTCFLERDGVRIQTER